MQNLREVINPIGSPPPVEIPDESSSAVPAFACLEVLAERICPDRLMFETIEDHILDGALRDTHLEGCLVWWETWKIFRSLIQQWQYSSLYDLDERLDDRAIVTYWLQSFNLRLSIYGLRSRACHKITVALSQDILRQFKKDRILAMDLGVHNKISGLYHLGHWKTADRLLLNFLDYKRENRAHTERGCRGFRGFAARQRLVEGLMNR